MSLNEMNPESYTKNFRGSLHKRHSSFLFVHGYCIQKYNSFSRFYNIYSTLCNYLSAEY